MTLYASKAGPNTSSDLYTIDPVTGVATSIATMTVALTGMAMDPTTNVMYGATSGSSNSPRRLVTVDLVTGATTIIGQFLEGGSGTGVSDISFDRSGQLWGWSSFSGKLLQIDKATGAFITRGASSVGTQGGGHDFDWQDNLFGIFNGDDGSLYQVRANARTTPVFPGVELDAGAGPDDLDDTYGQTALMPTRESGRAKVIAALHGTGASVAAGAMQGDKFYIIVNNFGSPVYLSTVDYYGIITTIGQTLDNIDALATDTPGGRSNWYGVSPYPFVESWEGATINTDKWTVYRQFGTSPINPNKLFKTQVSPDLDDLDELLDTTQEGESWFELTKSEHLLGVQSMLLNGYRRPTKNNSDRQQLVHWDELGGGTQDVEYWMAFGFMIPDWAILWNSNAGKVDLPDFRSTATTSYAGFSLIGNLLFPDSLTTGYFTDWDGNDHFLSAGTWHELRIGYMYRSSDSKAIVTQILDGVTIVDHSPSFGLGNHVRGLQWNSQLRSKLSFSPFEPPESLVYIDPIIWNLGSDPGPLAGFINPDFISSGTSLFQPSLSPASAAPLNVPFISSATVVYPVSYTGDFDVTTDFIDSETVVYAPPRLLGPSRARITQLPVEVIVQGESFARFTQVPVEVIVQGDSAARFTQVPVEAVVQNTRINVSSSFIYWVVGDPDA